MTNSRSRIRRSRLASLARAVALSAGVSLTACNWGPRPETLPFATSPVGASVRLRVVGERTDRRAELFAVDSSGLHFHEQRLRWIPWTRLRSLYVEKLDQSWRLTDARARPDDEFLAHLARLSRFPQGLRGELLAEVLLRLGQTAPEEIP